MIEKHLQDLFYALATIRMELIEYSSIIEHADFSFYTYLISVRLISVLSAEMTCILKAGHEHS